MARVWRCKCGAELSMTICGVTFCRQCHARGRDEIVQTYRPIQVFVTKTHEALAEEQHQREQGERRQW